MKYFISGNLGYIGPVLTSYIKNTSKDNYIIGFDTGFFESCYTHSNIFCETTPNVDIQLYGDMRDINQYSNYIEKCDFVIHLAAISNDPMGVEFAEVTENINLKSSIKLAKIAINSNAKSFVFASSCSVYGSGDSKPRIETDPVSPLTSYAKSKIGTEQGIKDLIKSFPDNNTKFTCLRFATACGASQRLRLDLVLNDFVATAVSKSKIIVLSDGSPWRPLIDVYDMTKALYWGCLRDQGEQLEIVNTGSNSWNYSIAQLADKVAELVENDVTIELNKNAQPDKRSYKVCFDKFESLAPKEFHSEINISKSVKALEDLIKNIPNELLLNRDHMIRLNVLKKLKAEKILTKDLRWYFKNN